MGSFIFLIIIIVIFFWWLVLFPLRFHHLGVAKGSLIVPVSVVADQGSVPEGKDSIGTNNNPCIPKLVVMCNPASDESPKGLESWIST